MLCDFFDVCVLWCVYVQLWEINSVIQSSQIADAQENHNLGGAGLLLPFKSRPNWTRWTNNLTRAALYIHLHPLILSISDTMLWQFIDCGEWAVADIDLLSSPAPPSLMTSEFDKVWQSRDCWVIQACNLRIVRGCQTSEPNHLQSLNWSWGLVPPCNSDIVS